MRLVYDLLKQHADWFTPLCLELATLVYEPIQMGQPVPLLLPKLEDAVSFSDAILTGKMNWDLVKEGLEPKRNDDVDSGIGEDECEQEDEEEEYQNEDDDYDYDSQTGDEYGMRE